LQTNITSMKVDAIVNAANTSLCGGGGVDGAIHFAAGPLLLAECEKLGGCPTGEARITRGYDLKAKFVIHAVGPVWEDGKHNEPELLASCYKNALTLAVENNVRTIAFPSISTGVYHFPKKLAAQIAYSTVSKFLDDNPGSIDRVCFVTYSAEDRGIYDEVVKSAEELKS
jgi:O-acetyl-ADP-ribose deacetylase